MFAAFLGQAGLILDPDALQTDPSSWYGITWGIVEGFKRWMLSIANRVSRAAREGGVLGIGSKLVSEKETTMIDELAGALGIDTARPN